MDLSDAFLVKKAGDAELCAHHLGRLTTSGRLIACDPLAGSSKPFALTFPKGCFDVQLLLAKRGKDTRVALARVVFSDIAPTRFALALRDGEDERALAPGQRFGYGVDAGMGSFIEAGFRDLIGDDIMDELERNRSITWTWARWALEGEGHRGLMFSSGYGDGIYSSYVGFAADGSLVQLVTDFGCLDLELPEVVDDSNFRALRAHQIWTELQGLLPSMATGETYGQAYDLGQELVASPEEAADLIEQMWAGLASAANEPVRDLHRYLIQSTLACPAALERSLSHLDLEDPETVRRLGNVRALPSSIREALWKRFDEMHPTLWEWFLMLVARDPDGSGEPRFIEGVRRALGTASSSDGMLGILVNRARHGPESVDDELRAQVSRLAIEGPTSRGRATALRILSLLGMFPDELLRDPDPLRRFEAASALSRKQANQDRCDPVLIELSRNEALTEDERLQAATSIWSETAKIDALVAIGLSGHPSAAIQIRYVGGEIAVAGLERLVAELEFPDLRKEAKACLERARKLVGS